MVRTWVFIENLPLNYIHIHNNHQRLLALRMDRRPSVRCTNILLILNLSRHKDTNYEHQHWIERHFWKWLYVINALTSFHDKKKREITNETSETLRAAMVSHVWHASISTPRDCCHRVWARKRRLRAIGSLKHLLMHSASIAQKDCRKPVIEMVSVWLVFVYSVTPCYLQPFINSISFQIDT